MLLDTLYAASVNTKAFSFWFQHSKQEDNKLKEEYYSLRVFQMLMHTVALCLRLLADASVTLFLCHCNEIGLKFR